MITQEHFNQKYKINEMYFSNIDSFDKAYFLGLLYADGNINIKHNRFEISLQEIDKDILELFAKTTFGNRPLYKKKWNGGPNHRNEIKWGYKLQISNKQILNDLINKGCFPQKSFILNFPKENQVSTELLSHFIRGYFDGDGSIMMKKRYGKEIGANISIISSINFSKQLYDFILNQLNIIMSIEIRQSYSQDMCILSTSKKQNIIKLFNFIYKDCGNFKLIRKYNKFLECIEKIKNKPNRNQIPIINPLNF